MTELGSSNPDTHIRTDNLATYKISAYMHIPTVDNPAYSTRRHASSTELPAPTQPSMGDPTIFANIVSAQEIPATTTAIESRPPALLPSTAS